MKKIYTKPKMEEVKVDFEASLLSVSGENPWWKEPEEEEGCENPWWCGK